MGGRARLQWRAWRHKINLRLLWADEIEQKKKLRLLRAAQAQLEAARAVEDERVQRLAAQAQPPKKGGGFLRLGAKKKAPKPSADGEPPAADLTALEEAVSRFEKRGVS